jgi:hypothetical protein
VVDDWCWFVLREEYYWLVAGGWFVVREKYCWLVADKPSEQALIISSVTDTTVAPNSGLPYYQITSSEKQRTAYLKPSSIMLMLSAQKWY